MTSTLRTPSATPDDDDAYFRAILLDLVDRGAELARTLHETTIAAAKPEIRPDATASAPNKPNLQAVADATIAYDRMIRAVRRTMALVRHIARNPAHATANQAAANRAAAKQAATARANLIRGVEDAIHRKRKEMDVDALNDELRERLDDPELEFDLAGRPTADIIEEICRDLGVSNSLRSFVFKRRTPKDIAELRARAAPNPAKSAPTPIRTAPA